jgi:hypothetical protein
VLDGVGVIRARLHQELLEVVCGQPRLTLAADHTAVICLLVIATVSVSHGCSLLKSLLVPLPAALGTLPSILGGDFGRCPLLLLGSG